VTVPLIILPGPPQTVVLELLRRYLRLFDIVMEQLLGNLLAVIRQLISLNVRSKIALLLMTKALTYALSALKESLKTNVNCVLADINFITNAQPVGLPNFKGTPPLQAVPFAEQ
jgi:hypothetical protein